MTSTAQSLPGTPPYGENITVLVVSPYEEDHSFLRHALCHLNWRLYPAHNAKEARNQLNQNRFSIVLCEKEFGDGDWKQIWSEVETLPCPPPLIVSSPHADDSLWAEVLNVGGYDVLVKPFEKSEVLRVMGLAWRHWTNLLDRSRRSQASAATIAHAAHF